MPEKRRFIRIQTAVDATYVLLNALSSRIKSRLVEICKGGFRLSDGNKIMKGAIIELCIVLPGEPDPIIAFAEEVWSKKKGRRNYEKGLRFIKIKDEDLTKLMQYRYNNRV